MSNIDRKKAVQNVVKYYDFFAYAPSLDEIYTFLSVTTSKKQLKELILEMIGEGLLDQSKILNSQFSILNSYSYTLPGHSIFAREKVRNREISLQKMSHVARFMQVVSPLSSIKFIGYSGSVAMQHAQKNDDIDVFIITAKRRLWTVRFLMMLAAVFMGYKRKRGVLHDKDKICMNLFFDERDLSVPQHKRNVYVGHEVLQMKPVLIRDDIYDRFLEANKWIYDFFPNGKKNSEFRIQNSELKFKIMNFESILPSLFSLLSSFGNFIELILKHIQLFLINRHKTSELVTDTQLWFFPQDFEKKLRKSRLL